MSPGKTLPQEKTKKDEKLQYYKNTKTHQGVMEGESKQARTSAYEKNLVYENGFFSVLLDQWTLWITAKVSKESESKATLA